MRRREYGAARDFPTRRHRRVRLLFGMLDRACQSCFQTVEWSARYRSMHLTLYYVYAASAY